jgi:hypothetical protein
MTIVNLNNIVYLARLLGPLKLTYIGKFYMGITWVTC